MHGFLISVQSTSKPITIATHVLLFHVTQAMAARDERQFDFATDWCEGRITDLEKSAVIGAVSGPIFEAAIDVGSVSVRATFVVRRADLCEVVDGIARGNPLVGVFGNPFPGESTQPGTAPPPRRCGADRRYRSHAVAQRYVPFRSVTCRGAVRCHAAPTPAALSMG